MGRHDQNNVSYFPFFCKYGDAMDYIQNQYKNDGFATWVKILRELAVKNYHFIDLRDKKTSMLLASKCFITESLLFEIIGVLCNFEEIDSEIWYKYQTIWNPKFIKGLEPVYERRKNKCLQKHQLIEFLTKNVDINDIYVDAGTQSKVKQSKVKQSKVNIEAPNFDFFTISNKLHKGKISEYLQKEHSIFIEQWVMKKKDEILPLTVFDIFDILDKEKNCYNFSNINHVQNSFKSIWDKNGKSKSTSNNSRNERLNSVEQMEDLAITILQGGKTDNNTGSH